MGGRFHTPSLRSWKRYGAGIVDIAERLGFEPIEVWSAFCELTLQCKYRLHVPLIVAEDSAWRLVRASYDKAAAVADESRCV